MNGLEPRVPKEGRQRRRRRRGGDRPHRATRKIDGHDPAADEVRDPATHRLNFRQFRHGGRLRRRHVMG
jgi:hypothetical protein